MIGQRKSSVINTGEAAGTGPSGGFWASSVRPASDFKPLTSDFLIATLELEIPRTACKINDIYFSNRDKFALLSQVRQSGDWRPQANPHSERARRSLGVGGAPLTDHHSLLTVLIADPRLETRLNTWKIKHFKISNRLKTGGCRVNVAQVFRPEGGRCGTWH